MLANVSRAAISAGSEAALAVLAAALTAISPAGSLAKASRCWADHTRAPELPRLG